MATDASPRMPDQDLKGLAAEVRSLRAEMEGLCTLMDERDRRMDERDRRYEQRFVAQETAVASALVSQEKFNSAAAQNAKEAILKAEAAQLGVNERSNEFRAQLGDQANTLMPRKESETLSYALREWIDREIKLLRDDIRILNQARSTVEGRSGGVASLGSIIFSGVMATIAIASVLVAVFK